MFLACWGLFLCITISMWNQLYWELTFRFTPLNMIIAVQYIYHFQKTNVVNDKKKGGTAIHQIRGLINYLWFAAHSENFKKHLFSLSVRWSINFLREWYIFWVAWLCRIMIDLNIRMNEFCRHTSCRFLNNLLRVVFLC